MTITYLGHAAFQLEIKGKQIIVDPFISANALASHIDIDGLKADYILLTHGHQDHVLDVERIAGNNPDAEIISGYEVTEWFVQKGLKGNHMNHGGTKQLGFGTVKYVNAIHSSSMPDGSYGGNPGGFVINDGENILYIAGDTALTYDMKLIPETCGPVDMAILPIGDTFTMGFKDAAIAAGFVQCKKVLGCHYDTFPPISIDGNEAAAYFSAKGLELLLPEIGQVIDI